MSGVSIVIPAFNEEGAIAGVLRQLLEVMDASQMAYEIIVVDDGSKDGTATAVQSIDNHDHLILLRHRRNKGYGAALKTGIRHAQYPLICITDADGTYPNERIPEFVHRLEAEEFDMVVGARTGGKVAIPLIRKPAKWVIGQLANLVVGEHIPDINSGLRIFRRAIALRFFNILPNKFSFTITITLAMMTNQYDVDFVPINYYARVGKSKIRPIQDTINFTQLVLRIALYFAPLRLFFPLSLFLFLIGVGWGVFTKFVLGQLADVTTLVIVMTAFQVATIGLLAELLNKRLPTYFKE